MKPNRFPDWQLRVYRVLTTPWVMLSALSGVVLVLYLPSLSNWGSVDDLTHIRAALYHEAPFKTFFRPLERWINEMNVSLLGYGDLRFALAVNLVGFFVTVGATYLLGRALYPNAKMARLFAAFVVALSSISTATNIQIDAISQQLATVFPLLFFLVLLRAIQLRSPALYILSFSCASLALLSKETSLGLLAATPLATFIGTFRLVDRPLRQKLATMLVHYVVLAIILFSYLGLRILLGYSFGGETSQYTLMLSPARLLKNAAFYFGGLAYIGGSSLDLLPVLKQGRVIVSATFSIILFSVSVIGLVHTLSRRFYAKSGLFALVLLTLAGSIPVIVTEQVSELYIYSSLPYFAMLSGLTFVLGCKQLAVWLGRTTVFAAAAVFSCCLFVWLAAGTFGKLAAHNEVSDQSWHYFTQIEAFVASAPEKTLNLCWAETRGQQAPAYSVFVRNPELLASRALTFARALHENQGDTRRIVVFGPLSSLSTKDRRACNYTLTMNGQSLDFIPTS